MGCHAACTDGGRRTQYGGSESNGQLRQDVAAGRMVECGRQPWGSGRACKGCTEGWLCAFYWASGGEQWRSLRSTIA